jgi:hypothetical protein
MPDRPFISRELDRRIASTQAAIDAGKLDLQTAEENLKPWAAAEAWLAGSPYPGTSPRDGHTWASDLSTIDDALAALTRARDRLAAAIDRQQRTDLLDHWRGMADAVRRLERQRDGNRAWRAGLRAAPPVQDVAFPKAQPSLLADMFDTDGNPLPLNEQRAA